jgi:amino acid transporter
LTTATESATQPELRRVLSLWDLIVYGVVLVMPIAAVPLFGLAQKLSGGHAVTTILIAMVAMGLTAVSYGRMAALYPSAGSAYTYVSLSLHPRAGFLIGWAMFLDYLLVPLICTIYGSLTLSKLIPGVPYAVWVVLFAAVITGVNLNGIQFTARTNLVLMIAMMAVISTFVALAIRMLTAAGGWAALVSLRPIYDPGTFHFSAILAATSVAALTYGGFDGVTTLAEEVHNPRRNVMLAAVIVCLFTGLFGGLQIYLAQLVWPDYHTFPNLETAFMDVSRKVGGPPLFQAMGIILVVANVGCGLAAQAGVSRLLVGMGRDGALPGRFFAHIDARTKSPSYNILLVGVLSCAGAFILNYESSAELINFGAFLAFMGVNAAVIRHSARLKFTGSGHGIVSGVLLPLAGLLFCFSIWISLSTSAKEVGAAWFAAGILFKLAQTRRPDSIFSLHENVPRLLPCNSGVRGRRGPAPVASSHAADRHPPRGRSADRRRLFGFLPRTAGSAAGAWRGAHDPGTLEPDRRAHAADRREGRPRRFSLHRVRRALG